jgi:hypothetical protein
LSLAAYTVNLGRSIEKIKACAEYIMCSRCTSSGKGGLLFGKQVPFERLQLRWSAARKANYDSRARYAEDRHREEMDTLNRHDVIVRLIERELALEKLVALCSSRGIGAVEKLKDDRNERCSKDVQVVLMVGGVKAYVSGWTAGSEKLVKEATELHQSDMDLMNAKRRVFYYAMKVGHMRCLGVSPIAGRSKSVLLERSRDTVLFDCEPILKSGKSLKKTLPDDASSYPLSHLRKGDFVICMCQTVKETIVVTSDVAQGYYDQIPDTAYQGAEPEYYPAEKARYHFLHGRHEKKGSSRKKNKVVYTSSNNARALRTVCGEGRDAFSYVSVRRLEYERLQTTTRPDPPQQPKDPLDKLFSDEGDGVGIGHSATPQLPGWLDMGGGVGARPSKRKAVEQQGSSINERQILRRKRLRETFHNNELPICKAQKYLLGLDLPLLPLPHEDILPHHEAPSDHGSDKDRCVEDLASSSESDAGSDSDSDLDSTSVMVRVSVGIVQEHRLIMRIFDRWGHVRIDTFSNWATTVGIRVEESFAKQSQYGVECGYIAAACCMELSGYLSNNCWLKHGSTGSDSERFFLHAVTGRHMVARLNRVLGNTNGQQPHNLKESEVGVLLRKASQMFHKSAQPGALRIFKEAVSFPKLICEVADMVVDARKGYVPPTMLISNVDAYKTGGGVMENKGTHWFFVMIGSEAT